ncbi:MAG: nucleoid-associated protein, YbaB/EbfC family [Deltaproteobacteria bacterium RBG_16_71_12]|nr:MAG: nucleoid-associated protein, YbaB/EbfC family [Deltaproteobacteria bacterium RBG_16_71_12]
MIDPSKLQDMMREAQRLQERMQAELKAKVVEGQSGGGMVRVTLNGLLEVQSVKIEKGAVDPADLTLLEDLVRAALAQAIQRAEEARMEHTRSLAGNLGLPSGMF